MPSGSRRVRYCIQVERSCNRSSAVVITDDNLLTMGNTRSFSYDRKPNPPLETLPQQPPCSHEKESRCFSGYSSIKGQGFHHPQTVVSKYQLSQQENTMSYPVRLCFLPGWGCPPPGYSHQKNSYHEMNSPLLYDILLLQYNSLLSQFNAEILLHVIHI